MARSLAKANLARVYAGLLALRKAIGPRNIASCARCALIKLRYRNLHCGWFFIERGADVAIGRSAAVTIGRDVRISRDFTCRVRGRLRIGSGVFFNRSCMLVALESVEIGENCLFGEMVSIHDENHVSGHDLEPIARRGLHTAPVVIGNSVWVGAKATILAGVTIGDNSVIGAGAVVTRDVPPGVVAGGIPARVIREL